VLAAIDRLADDLRAELRALSLSGPRARAATRTALAAVLAALTALALHLENPWWAAITAVVIVQAAATATLGRSIERAAGTTIGAGIGYLASATVADHLLFLIIIGSCTAFVIYAQERAEHGYAFLLGGVTIVLIMFGSLAIPGAALHLAVYRALEIYVGVIAACIVDIALAESNAHSAAYKPGVWTPPIDLELAVIAVTGGITISLIPLIWETLELPGLGQTPITAFVILNALRQEPNWKALTRAAGCLLGGLYGLAAMHVVGDAFVLWLIAFAVGVYAAAHIGQGGGDASYVGLQAGVAIVIAMVQGQAPSPDISPAVNRLIGVFGGVIIVSICQPLLVPLISWAVRLREWTSDTT
jgi:uncharacterized membrane protein YccC